MQEQPYEDVDDISPTLASGVKLVIMAASLGVASVAGFYLHPHLPPLLTESVQQIWRAAEGWLTAPILFVLLNVVVGTLYFRSSMLSGGRSSERSAAAPLASAAAGAVPPAEGAALAKERKSEKKPSAGLRARYEKSKTLTRLVRSKSEQIPPISAGEASGLAGGSGPGYLKKAGTFEQVGRLSRKPVVVVADPPADASPPPGHEEVDQKAEAFISKFYQKVKLQRLDSLLRQQQQQQAN